jgi:hypothetical protein
MDAIGATVFFITIDDPRAKIGPGTKVCRKANSTVGANVR